MSLGIVEVELNGYKNSQKLKVKTLVLAFQQAADPQSVRLTLAVMTPAGNEKGEYLSQATVTVPFSYKQVDWLLAHARKNDATVDFTPPNWNGLRNVFDWPSPS